MGLRSSVDEEYFAFKEKIGAAGINAAKSMQISDSFFSVDILLVGERVIVIECGILLDCKIDRLLNAAGVNVYDHFIRLKCGENIIPDVPPFEKGYGLVFMYASKNGELIINDSLPQKKHVVMEWERNQFDSVNVPLSVSDTIGWVIREGDYSHLAFLDAEQKSKSNIFEVRP